MIFWGIKGEMHMIFGFTAVNMAQGERAVTRLQLEEQNREESPRGAPSPTMTAQRTVTAIATITPRLLPVSAAKGRRTEWLQKRR